MSWAFFSFIFIFETVHKIRKPLLFLGSTPGNFEFFDVLVWCDIPLHFLSGFIQLTKGSSLSEFWHGVHILRVFKLASKLQLIFE